MKTTASLFTGGGGWDIGATQARMTPVWGVEFDPNKVKFAQRNIPDFTVFCSDVATMDYTLLPKTYHLHASTSCKYASIANANVGETEEDMSAATAVCDALRAGQPQSFTLENVWQYRDFDSFRLIVKTLRELAYSVDWWHLNTANYGVPQTRKRLILIADKNRQPIRPTPTHSKTHDMFGLYKPWVGWYESIEDLIPSLPDCELADWQVERLPDEWRSVLLNVKDKNQEWGELNKATEKLGFSVGTTSRFTIALVDPNNTSRLCSVRNAAQPSVTVTGTHTRRPASGMMLLGQDSKLTKRHGHTPSMTVTGSNSDELRAIVDGNNASKLTMRSNGKHRFTVTANQDKNKLRLIDNYTVKRITPRALARFQTFPDSYQLPQNKRLAGEIIGNAVPCKFAKAICKTL